MIQKLGFALLVLSVAGCYDSGSGQSSAAGGPHTSGGMTAVLLTDGPIQVVNDNRTIVSLEIDITRVTLESEESESDEFEAEDKVVVFDAASGDNGGNPLTVDLLALADSSALLGLLTVPLGTYEEAKLTISAARAEFEDDPGVLVDLVLGGDDDGPAGVLEFEFDPPVTVSAEGTTVATIDFVPVVTKVGDQYVLTHDGDNDESGESEQDEDIQFKGAITSISGDLTTITIEGVSEPIDISGAKIEVNDVEAGPSSLAVGQVVKVEGVLDATLNVIVASEVEVGDDDDDGESDSSDGD